MKETVEEVEQRLVREVAAILRKNPAAVGVDTALPSLGMDSMGFVELLVRIERVFQIRLVDAGLTREDFETIRALARRIGRSVAS